MRKKEDSTQLRRLAHRLQALYVCEMSGKGCIDPVYRQLRQEPPSEVFMDMAGLLLPMFHKIFLAQMDASPTNQTIKQLIAFEEFDAKKHTPQ